MPYFAINAAIHLILLIIGIDPVLGNKAITLHVAEGLIKAGIVNNGINKGLHAKFLSHNAYRRIKSYGLNRIGIKPLDFLCPGNNAQA
ncbi:hypothetical protein D9M68_555930 [compost metagenome]